MPVDPDAEKLAQNRAAVAPADTSPTPAGVPSLANLAANAVNRAKAPPRPGGQTRGARDRLNSELSGLTPGTPEYDDAVVALPLDWSDPEYAVILLQEKMAAKGRQKDRLSPGVVHGMTAEEISAGRAANDMTEQQAWADKVNKAMGAEYIRNADGSLSNVRVGEAPPVDSQRAGGGRPEDADAGAAHRRETLGKPIIRGLPVDAGTVLGESSTTGDGSGLSEWVRQWATKQGLDVTYEDAQEAAKTGDFVYVGQEEDAAGGPGYKRDVYLYKDDAIASLANLSMETIAEYQSKLGLEVNGIIDPKLAGLWKDAVDIAGQIYARNGTKVELKFIFDTLVATAVAGGGLGSGGGGGGRNRADSDYYFDMMQVLGDISGVKQSGQ